MYSVEIRDRARARYNKSVDAFDFELLVEDLRQKIERKYYTVFMYKYNALTCMKSI